MTLWPGVMVDVFKDNGQGGVVPVNVHTLHWQWLQPLEIRWTSHNGGQSVVAMHAANTGMKPHFSHKLPGLPISEVHCTQLASGTIINATHTLIDTNHKIPFSITMAKWYSVIWSDFIIICLVYILATHFTWLCQISHLYTEACSGYEWTVEATINIVQPSACYTWPATLCGENEVAVQATGLGHQDCGWS